jgi:response regulator RpfG family c-di-GMP phosphodiesterase
MPKKNGLEVLKEVKSDRRLQEIPVMVLTSSQSNRDTEDTYEAKANFYIVKPSNLDGFYEVMKYVEEIWLSSLQYRDSSEKS